MIEKYLDILGGLIPKTKIQCEALTSGTYALGITIALILLVVAIIVTKLIINRPDQSEIRRRKIWFWSLSSLGPILFTLYNFLYLMNNFVGVSPRCISDFKTAAGITFLIMLVVYVGLGVLLSFIFRNSNLGSWFFSNKK